MKSGALIFLAAFIALSASWAGFVLAPQLQLGRKSQVKLSPMETLYPAGRPGLARQGAQVYRSLGCVHCHSQEIGQEGVKCEIVLADAGTNSAATLAALGQVRSDFAKPETLDDLPKTLMEVADMNAADPILKTIRSSGAKATAQVSAIGPDIARGWGKRRSVAEDYVFDTPVQLGVHRVGPDLANIGVRQPDVNWQLRHLYAPAAVVSGSTMPPYRFLFEERKLSPGQQPSPDTIPPTLADTFMDLSKDTGPIDCELVPKEDARALAAYLVSLRADPPLFEAPFTAPAPPEVSTNAPASTNNVASLPVK